MKLTSVVKGHNYQLQVQIIKSNILDTLKVNTDTTVINSFLNVVASGFTRLLPVFRGSLCKVYATALHSI